MPLSKGVQSCMDIHNGKWTSIASLCALRKQDHIVLTVNARIVSYTSYIVRVDDFVIKAINNVLRSFFEIEHHNILSYIG